MLNNQQTAIVPAYVLAHYSEFINDKQLLALMNLAAIPYNTKASWEVAAERMGYKRFGDFAKLIEAMRLDGIVTVDVYQVDATPLWDACRNVAEGKAAEFSKISEPEPEPKDNTHYKLASTIFNNLWTNYNNRHGLATKIKSLLNHYDESIIFEVYQLANNVKGQVNITNPDRLVDEFLPLTKDYTIADIQGLIDYVFNTKNLHKEQVTPIFTSSISTINMDKWIEGGRKSVYEAKPVKFDLT